MDRLSQPNTYHRTEMNTEQQAIEALDELLRDAFMYIRHNPGAGSDPLLVRLKGSKAMMDALASVPQQDVGACRSVPSEYVMSNVRPAVAWFAEQMEAALRRNDHKGGWAGMDHETLLMRCGDEMVELKHCWNLGNGAQVKGDKHIVAEAADVANFAMMIADNYGSRIGDALLAVPSRPGEIAQQLLAACVLPPDRRACE